MQSSQIIDIQPKNQESEIVQEAVLEVNMAEDGNQAGMGHMITLDIFLSYTCNTTGAIDVFTRRVGSWKMNDFVAAL